MAIYSSFRKTVVEAVKIPLQDRRMIIMRTLSVEESNSTSGGILAALGVTGIGEGLAVAAEGGALGFAWAVGYGLGTAIYAGYNLWEYGEA